MVAGLFNIVSHYRPTAQSLFLAGSLFVAPIIPHYVNIALGSIFWPCLFVCRVSEALWILFFTLKINNNKKQKTMCRKSIGTKSMTKNKPAGQGSGAATKNAGANGRFLGAARNYGLSLSECLNPFTFTGL